MTHPSVDLHEVAENIAYVIPHVSSSGGYQSMIMLLESDGDRGLRYVECTKPVADVAKKYGLTYLAGNTAINLNTASEIEHTGANAEATNFMAHWVFGNRRFSLPVRANPEQVPDLLVGQLRGAAASRLTNRAAKSGATAKLAS